MKTAKFAWPLLLASMFSGSTMAQMGTKPEVTLHSHGSFHRKGKLKGWMKEKRRCSFNKNR